MENATTGISNTTAPTRIPDATTIAYKHRLTIRGWANKTKRNDKINKKSIQLYPIALTNNQYAALATNDKDTDADDIAVTTSNCKTRPNNHKPKHTQIQQANLTISTSTAIADAGATGHFLLPGAKVTNKKRAVNPITLPNGAKLQSTHTCNISLPLLPKEATEAHIVPGFTHTSLISISMLCNANCTVTYDRHRCTVKYNNKTIWTGTCDTETGLWLLHLTKEHNTSNNRPPKEPQINHTANNAYQMTNKTNLITYLHQALFCPPKRTLLKAILNFQLTTWLGLSARAIQKYLPDSCPATDKGI